MKFRRPRIVHLAGLSVLTAAGMVLSREARVHGDLGILLLPLVASGTLLMMGRAAITATLGPKSRRPFAAGFCLFGLAYLGLGNFTLLPDQLLHDAIDANSGVGFGGGNANWIGRTSSTLGFGTLYEHMLL